MTVLPEFLPVGRTPFHIRGNSQEYVKTTFDIQVKNFLLV